MKILQLTLLASLSLLSACALFQKGEMHADATNTTTATAAEGVAANNPAAAATSASDTATVPASGTTTTPVSSTATASDTDAKVSNSVAVPEVFFTQDVLNDLRARPDGGYFSQGLLRSISSQVRASLIDDGITVFEAKNPTPASSQITDVLARIEQGDFGQAQYVLFGVASHVMLESHAEPIPGTTTNMDDYQLTIAVDYSMIDTTTREVISSFQAVGKGIDSYLTDKGSSRDPKRSDLILAAQRKLAEDVAKNLEKQGILTASTASSSTPLTSAPGSKILGPDLKSLKIYRK